MGHEVTVSIGNRVEVIGLDPTDLEHRSITARLLERFTFDNPIYWEARRHRRPCRHIPRRIVLAETDGNRVRCPRGALPQILRILGPSVRVEDRTVCPKRGPLAFVGRLRDYQEAAVQAVLRDHQGVIQAPTGSGKTVIALALISRIPTPALIVVHTSILFEQMAEAVRRFLGIAPGLIGRGHDEPGDVTVAMVQTLMRRNLAAWRDRFGLVILDEAHHCPAETFKTVVQEFAARYRVGLSATPTRKDRLHPILFDVMGPILHVVTPRTLLASGSLAHVEVVQVETGFRGRCPRDYASLLNRIVRDGRRNAVIIEAVLKHRGRRSLVLTERVEHARLLAKVLASRGMKVAALTGVMTREERDVVVRGFSMGDLESVVATTALVGEGFDLPALDTVFVTVPHANPAKTTQILGRALRPSEGKVSGRVVDFVDSEVPLLRRQAERRMRVYRRYLR